MENGCQSGCEGIGMVPHQQEFKAASCECAGEACMAYLPANRPTFDEVANILTRIEGGERLTFCSLSSLTLHTRDT